MNQRDLFLLDSARLSFAPGVILEGTGLTDGYSGDACALNAVGLDIARQLETGVTIKELLRDIEETYDVARSDVRIDLENFIANLYAAGILSIRQSYLSELVARAKLLLTRSLRRPIRKAFSRKQSPHRRYPATPWGIVSGSFKAHQPTMVLGLLLALAIQPVVFLPLIRHGYLPPIRAAFSVAQPAIIYTALLVTSIVLHELIHYWTARRLGVPLKSVYVGPGTVGITQLDVGSLRNAAVSAAGPAGTVLVLIALAILIPLLHLGYPLEGIAAPMLCLAVGTVHFLGLTPLTNDGKQFWRLMGFVEVSPPEVA